MFDEAKLTEQQKANISKGRQQSLEPTPSGRSYYAKHALPTGDLLVLYPGGDISLIGPVGDSDPTEMPLGNVLDNEIDYLLEALTRMKNCVRVM